MIEGRIKNISLFLVCIGCDAMCKVNTSKWFNIQLFFVTDDVNSNSEWEMLKVTKIDESRFLAYCFEKCSALE